MKTVSLSYITITLLVSAVFVFSCSKERIQPKQEEEQEQQEEEKDEEDKSLSEYEDLNDYYDTKKQDEQEFEITQDADSAQPITGNQGTKIYQAKDLFMYPNGDSVEYPYTIKLIELYTPKDMIYYELPSMDNNKILQTHGAIRVMAYKDGQELVLRPNRAIMVEMPHPSATSDKLVYYGRENGSKIDFTTDLASLGQTANQPGQFLNNSDGYNALVERLGWINCATEKSNGNGYKLDFTSTTDDLSNIDIFIYFSNQEGLMQVYDASSSKIPSGFQATILCIGIDASGNLFSFTESTSVSSSQTIDVVLSSTSDANLTALLNGL